MKKAFGFLLLALLVAAPAGAQPMSAATMGGTATLQYYVGTWSCMAGEPGKPMDKATATYTLQSGVLHEFIDVPSPRTMKTPYAASSATTYDAKHGRYVATWLGNQGDASSSTAKPWTGNTEKWTDTYNNTGKLGRTDVVRTSQNRFDFTGYPSAAATQPNFKGYCTR